MTEPAQLVEQWRKLNAEIETLQNAYPSAKEYLALAMRYANVTRQRLEELVREIAASTSPGHMPSLLRVLKHQYIATTHDRSRFYWPFRDGQRLLAVLGRGYDNDFSRFRTHPLEVFALAVLQATEEDPRRFGTITDLAAHTARLESLQRQRTEMALRLRATRDRLAAQIADVQGVIAELERVGA